MDHDAEVDVEEKKVSPGQRELFLLIPLDVLQEVHVNTEGNILNHDQAVGNGNPSKNHVDWIVLHVFMCEHQNVGDVEHYSENADRHCQMAVEVEIAFL